MSQPDPWKPDRSARTSRLQKVKLADAPTPVIARAEQLCDLVDEADGIRPDRGELIAALIHDAKPNGLALAAVWKRYRTAPVHAVVLNESLTSGALNLTGFKKR
jgi:hypothetical protein